MDEENVRCPYLVPVTADSLWMYPMPAYCSRPDEQVKVPAHETLFRVCVSHRHLRCPGYMATVGGVENADA